MAKKFAVYVVMRIEMEEEYLEAICKSEKEASKVCDELRKFGYGAYYELA